ncbi:MAG: hypothetical protein A2W86_09275 [Bacteroidetes bacterium GWD2_45_23]|nr:MAG: hypothetical protein A2W87_11545 [Bacteroidetes bacterium GWC2_46_850]OFX77478.1 MAG: hypothetical protein A2071_06315 [Bacteroidetes bacterium GWC1_47_7]OFX83504.1 MAG: hypothetical protein A2W86_09275 [Bacteroidetes bacterium GWD2_45_23]HBB02136.1 hypothetical protein [Porphyromonadaceae bacterium]HCC17706.1 hypothetical protein [Porphyromonadaceae bacterium]
MTFYNNLDQILLERKVDNDINYDTYYVYDDFGNLRFVLPPAASDALTAVNVIWDITSNQVLKDYAFYYQYDGKNNCILKKLPGCNDIEMRYDMSERLIFSKMENNN